MRWTRLAVWILAIHASQIPAGPHKSNGEQVGYEQRADSLPELDQGTSPLPKVAVHAMPDKNPPPAPKWRPGGKVRLNQDAIRQALTMKLWEMMLGARIKPDVDPGPPPPPAPKPPQSQPFPWTI